MIYPKSKFVFDQINPGIQLLVSLSLLYIAMLTTDHGRKPQKR